MQDALQFKSKPYSFSLPFSDDKIDLRTLYFALLVERRLILSVALMTLVFGIFYAISITPQYKANVLFQVESKQAGATLLNNFSALGEVNSASSADIQTTLIKSPFILSSVVESLGLDVNVQPHYFPLFGSMFARHHANALHKPILSMHQYAWGGEDLQIAEMHVPINAINKRLKLMTGPNNTYQVVDENENVILEGKANQIAKNKDNSFSILVKSLKANPGTEFFLTKVASGNIADHLASQLQINDLGQTYQLNKTGVLQMSLVGPNPKKIVDLLNAIAIKTVQSDVENKSTEAAQTLKILNQQLPLVKASLNSAEAALNQYRMRSGTIDLTIKSRILLKQVSDVQRQIEGVNLSRIVMLQQYTPAHPFIIGLSGKKEALQRELLSLEKELQQVPASDQVAVSLMRDIKVRTQLYLMLLHKAQELQVIKGGTVSNVRILNLAALPTASLPTGRGLVILISLLFGLIAGSLIVLLRKAFHRCVDDPNWLEKHFGVPTFAIIPYSTQQKTNVQQYKEKNETHLHLLAHKQPRDLAIESLRSLRTSLQFALIGAKNNIISVMGISPGIGKSFISANFAHILADSGKRILLIDGDIRKGYLHDYFTGTRAPGLSEAISGEQPLINVVRKTHLPLLDFIASGQLPPNPSELLLSDQFKEILDSLSVQYDLVIIDTAPILAVTDGAIIAHHAGVNFLVIAAGTHQEEEINHAMKRLHSNNVKIQGAIYNNMSARYASTHNPYSYHYEYGET